MKLTNRFVVLAVAAIFIGQAIGYLFCYHLTDYLVTAWQFRGVLTVLTVLLAAITAVVYRKSDGINPEKSLRTAATTTLASVTFAGLNGIFTSLQTQAFAEIFLSRAFYAVFFAILLALVYSYLSVTQKGDK